jgi:hypothetical protein
LVVGGSALFSEVVAGGGTFQLSTRADCVVTLTVYDGSGHPVEVWSGIPGEITGGRKEFPSPDMRVEITFDKAVGRRFGHRSKGERRRSRL